MKDNLRSALALAIGLALALITLNSCEKQPHETPGQVRYCITCNQDYKPSYTYSLCGTLDSCNAFQIALRDTIGVPVTCRYVKQRN